MLNRVDISGSFMLEKGLLLPSFQDETFPFFLSYGEESFDLVNLKNGRVESLICGSASNIFGQQAAFFMTRGVGKFELNFCTTRHTADGRYEHNWYKMPFNPDFFGILRDYGQLPIASIKESLDVVKEREALKMTIEHTLLPDE